METQIISNTIIIQDSNTTQLVCSGCQIHYTPKAQHESNSLPLCYKCDMNNKRHFICNYCRHKVHFYESKIPEYHLIGKRAFCLHCYQWYLYEESNTKCKICDIPIMRDINKKEPLVCRQCQKGCRNCREKDPKLLCFRSNSYSFKFRSDYTLYCYCKKCVNNMNKNRQKKTNKK